MIPNETVNVLENSAKNVVSPETNIEHSVQIEIDQVEPQRNNVCVKLCDTENIDLYLNSSSISQDNIRDEYFYSTPQTELNSTALQNGMHNLHQKVTTKLCKLRKKLKDKRGAVQQLQYLNKNRLFTALN